MKKLIILLMAVMSFGIFAEGSSAEKKAGDSKIVVLCYHSFLGSAKNDYDLSMDVLKEQLNILKEKGFTFITYDEFKSGTVKGTKNILVTIDDGYVSSYEAYKTIFKPMGIKPVFAIYPTAISEKSKLYMNWEQVKELSADGLEIAAHGYRHDQINQKLYDKSKQRFEDEIYKSKSTLEEKLGKKVETFIYPFGIRSPITVEYLKKAGYKYGFTINWGTVNVELDKNKSLYELPRYMLTQKEWKNEFKIIAGK